MARYWYGDSNDWSLAAGGDGSLKLRASTKKYYDAESGGAQYTDLLIGGVTAATQVATDGLPVRFQGPYGVTEMWESANNGPRVLISTTDQDENVAELAAQVAEDRAAVEALGATTDAVIAGRINASGSATQVALATALASAQAKVDVTAVTNTYTLVLADAGKVVECNKATAFTVTIPPESSVAWPTGTILEIFQLGAGQITVAAGVGVTLLAPFGAKTAAQYSTLSLRKRAADTWVLAGDSST